MNRDPPLVANLAESSFGAGAAVKLDTTFTGVEIASYSALLAPLKSRRTTKLPLANSEPLKMKVDVRSMDAEVNVVEAGRIEM